MYFNICHLAKRNKSTYIKDNKKGLCECLLFKKLCFHILNFVYLIIYKMIEKRSRVLL